MEPALKYRNDRSAHWQKIAEHGRRETKLLHASYKKYLQKLYRFLVPEGLRVLELGCAEGNLLAALKPSHGVGIDFAPAMLELAKKRYANLHFLLADIHDLNKKLSAEVLADPFDVVILSDVVNDSWDVLELLKNLKQFCKPETRIIFNFHSHLWEHPFHVFQKLELVTPRLVQNWFTPEDMKGLLDLAGYKLISSFNDYMFPLPIPCVAVFFNRFMSKLWPFSMLNVFHVQIAKPMFTPEQPPSVSIIIPARNEAGNIEAALQRTPDLGAGTEIIFVEGNSTDNTWDVIQEMARKYSHRKIKILRQPGRGKGDAVRVGFDAAEGDVLMILDADLTMPPETLPQFYDAIASGRAEFVNGVRLVYPQEKQAMRFFNLLGNKFFAWAFSWLLGRPIKDTLCGTKVLSRKNYQKITANRNTVDLR